MAMSVSEIMVSKDSEQFLTVTKMPEIMMISQRERERFFKKNNDSQLRMWG
jgi:hypothetical protein